MPRRERVLCGGGEVPTGVARGEVAVGAVETGGQFLGMVTRPRAPSQAYRDHGKAADPGVDLPGGFAEDRAHAMFDQPSGIGSALIAQRIEAERACASCSRHIEPMRTARVAILEWMQLDSPSKRTTLSVACVKK